MSRVITFSRQFPATHPRKGDPTYFVEQILKGLNIPDYWDWFYTVNDPYKIDTLNDLMRNFKYNEFNIKGHTIRAGNRWKVGDKFSPRVWSGKPYQSKQIIIAPDIEIKKIWNIEIMHAHSWFSVMINGKENHWHELAKNDGLSPIDFIEWFKKSGNMFIGQIICWSDHIEYCAEPLPTNAEFAAAHAAVPQG